MQSFTLEEMILVSRSEKRARKVQFHPKATVIKGPNDTGKSSLIKSIFTAFGATPTHIHPLWKAAGVSSLLKFKVDGKLYKLYRHGSVFSLFLRNDVLVGTYDSITNELGPRLAEIFDFNLMLEEHNGGTKIPPPAFLLLPFYIDQDEGWAKNWSSFENLRQFKNWRRDLVYYHTGIRQNEWYKLTAKAKDLAAKKEEPLRQEQTLKEVMRRLQERLVNTKFDIDVSHYKKQIDRLLSRCENLKRKSRNIRKNLWSSKPHASE